jgi:hypothetical protein
VVSVAAAASNRASESTSIMRFGSDGGRRYSWKGQRTGRVSRRRPGDVTPSQGLSRSHARTRRCTGYVLSETAGSCRHAAPMSTGNAELYKRA